MQEVWTKLKEVKKGLKDLNNKEFKGVVEKIKKARGQLQELQGKMRDPTQAINTYDTEKLLKEKLEKWNLIEESIYKQKSRNKWLKEGDCNTAYFFTSAKSRKAQNLIITLQNENGDTVSTEAGIEEEVLGFYNNLLGTTNQAIPAIQPHMLNNEPTLTREQQTELIKPFSAVDVYQALKDIGDMKAPCIDGFNSCFLKKRGQQ
ncbi:uncharacterized protein LOC132057879 [Lycium ferocissimum]|uniref:uncharacterized protein LOC132057879 n=1 Tax=Lycium ferocissimum TaxID=112874 RepID=UPI002815D7FB|nr:uncharacterized protein LOC132057879 [Lycium ferocissimum]